MTAILTAPPSEQHRRRGLAAGRCAGCCTTRHRSSLIANLAPEPTWCSSTARFVPGPWTGGDGFDAGATGIILAVTPHRAGRIDIVGVQVDYGEGDRSGSQRTGVEISLTAHEK